jgi:Ca-activated chloride channel homolog
MPHLTPLQRRLAVTIVFASLLTGIADLGHAWEAGAFDCRSFVVASSQEKYPLMTTLGAAYNAAGRQVDGQCVNVKIEEVNSGDAERALETGWDSSLGIRPDVWSPASTAWLALLQQRSSRGGSLISPGETSFLFQSPLVIAMPLPMATALGYPSRPIGWTEILALARNPLGWASIPGADPHWGAFKLGKTDPTVSTSGLHALLGTYYAATGGNLTPATVVDPTVGAFVAGIETSVVHYGQTAKTFLTTLNAADAQGNALSYVSAIALEEEELINYNRGHYDPNGVVPATPLVAIYPREGTAFADHPFVVLSWSSGSNRAAANDFRDFLGQDPQQGRIQAEGFRTNFSGLSDDILAGDPYVQANPPLTILPTNNGRILDAMVSEWKKIRKHARVLILVDVASQDTPAQGIRWATESMIRALGGFDSGGSGDPGDEVALWTFPGANGPYTAGNFSTPPGSLAQTLGKLKASSSTASLDNVLESAVVTMTATYEPSRIDAILLMTGSPSDIQTSDLQLERTLRNQPSDRFVRVFVVSPPGLSQKAQGRLMGIALAGRGALYQPTSTRTLIDDVVTNF